MSFDKDIFTNACCASKHHLEETIHYVKQLERELAEAKQKIANAMYSLSLIVELTDNVAIVNIALETLKMVAENPND